jgi:cytochrome bd-type quinol oxidase subunit 1
MFSTGQLIFAILFFIAFVIVIIFSYKKDKKLHKKNYKGSVWILVSFAIFILLLFLIKHFLKN